MLKIEKGDEVWFLSWIAFLLDVYDSTHRWGVKEQERSRPEGNDVFF